MQFRLIGFRRFCVRKFRVEKSQRKASLKSRHLVLQASVLAACWSSGSTLVTPRASAQTATQTFEETARALKPLVIQSASQLRGNLTALNGNTVDVQGKISGLLTREGSKTILLKIGDDVTLISAPAEINSPLIRAGTAVRIIARVDVDKSTPLAMLAITNAPLDEAVPIVATTTTGDAAEIVTATTAAIDGELALPQPPAEAFVTTTPAPKPQPRPMSARGGGPRVTAPARVQATRPASKPASGSSLSSIEAEEAIDSQKPAYEALVRRHNNKLQPAVVSEIAEALLRAGYKHNMDPRFLAAVIAVESDFDVHCLSRSGAMGLGQIMPFNLKEAQISNPWNPTENVFGTARLLRGHLDSYKNRSNGTLLAVAAYNAGPGAVRRAGYKVPNGAQVQRYVWKVYYRYKAFAPDMF
jgi:soluble lytic murein transglycosylase-like protein